MSLVGMSSLVAQRASSFVDASATSRAVESAGKPGAVRRPAPKLARFATADAPNARALLIGNATAYTAASMMTRNRVA